MRSQSAPDSSRVVEDEAHSRHLKYSQSDIDEINRKWNAMMLQPLKPKRQKRSKSAHISWHDMIESRSLSPILTESASVDCFLTIPITQQQLISTHEILTNQLEIVNTSVDFSWNQMRSAHSPASSLGPGGIPTPTHASESDMDEPSIETVLAYWKKVKPRAIDSGYKSRSNSISSKTVLSYTSRLNHQLKTWISSKGRVKPFP